MSPSVYTFNSISTFNIYTFKNTYTLSNQTLAIPTDTITRKGPTKLDLQRVNEAVDGTGTTRTVQGRAYQTTMRIRAVRDILCKQACYALRSCTDIHEQRSLRNTQIWGTDLPALAQKSPESEEVQRIRFQAKDDNPLFYVHGEEALICTSHKVRA